MIRPPAVVMLVGPSGLAGGQRLHDFVGYVEVGEHLLHVVIVLERIQQT